jgi:hypothetical protein
MFNNAALDVVIGLVFVYLLYSLLGTLLQEIVATNIGLRGRILKMAIRRMLDDGATKSKSQSEKFSQSYYDHPLIKYLRADAWAIRKDPAYFTQETFSKVVIDLLRGKEVKPGDPIRPLIDASLTDKKLAWDPNVKMEEETHLYLQTLWTDSQGDVQKFKGYLEQWFNEMMDRTTGWYKKYTQLILLILGLGIAMGFNVDTLKIADKLKNDPQLREQVVAQASDFTKAHPNLNQELAERKKTIDSLLSIMPAKKDSIQRNTDPATGQLQQLRDSLYNQASDLVNGDIKRLNDILGIGWDGGFLGKEFDAYSIPGWILTALAISFGAPFWFDILNKLIKLRGSTPPADKSNAGKETTPVKKIERVG